jgi:hypothetical protein
MAIACVLGSQFNTHVSISDVASKVDELYGAQPLDHMYSCRSSVLAPGSSTPFELPAFLDFELLSEEAGAVPLPPLDGVPVSLV